MAIDNIEHLAISEKQINKWNQAGQLELIHQMNPNLMEIYKNWFDHNDVLIEYFP